MVENTRGSSSSHPPTLAREVLAPRAHDSGLGVMVVAAMAMFFAVASSAFVVRARAARCAAKAPPPVIVAPSAAIEAPADQRDGTDGPACGTPLYRHNADGSVSIFYRVCADGQTPDGAAVPRSAPVIPVLETR